MPYSCGLSVCTWGSCASRSTWCIPPSCSAPSPMTALPSVTARSWESSEWPRAAVKIPHPTGKAQHSFCFCATSSCDVLLTTVAGLKLLRSSFCDPSFQFLTLLFTLVFFYFDCPHASESFLLDFFVMSIVFHKVKFIKLALLVKRVWWKLEIISIFFPPRCASCC